MIQYLSVAQAAKFIENNACSLIDIREPHEWEQGYLQGAVLIPKSQLLGQIDSFFPDLEQCLILYCAVGLRAKWGAQQLLQLGYKNIYVLYPGYEACKQANFIISQSKQHEK